MSLFEQFIARSFDECQRIGSPEWLEGWFEAGMELALEHSGRTLAANDLKDIGLYAGALASEMLDLLKVWRKHCGCCSLTRGMMAGLGTNGLGEDEPDTSLPDADQPDYDPSVHRLHRHSKQGSMVCNHEHIRQVVHVSDNSPCWRIYCDREHYEKMLGVTGSC